MANIITSIQVGKDRNMNYYITNPEYKNSPTQVDTINEEKKQISTNSQITVYRGYRGNDCVFEIEAGIGIILTFKQD